MKEIPINSDLLWETLDHVSDEVFILNEDFLIQFANSAACLRRSCGRSALQRISFLNLVQEDSVKTIKERLNLVSKTAGANDELVITLLGEAKKPYKSFTRIRRYSAHSQSWLIIYASKYSTQRNFHKEPILHHAVMDQFNGGIIIEDLTGTVTFWNDAATQILGWTKSEMMGRSLRRIIPDDQLPEEDYFSAHLKEKKVLFDLETKCLTKDGQLVEVSLSLTPVALNDQVIGAFWFIRDIRDVKSVQHKLDGKLARLKMAQKASRIGIWAWDLQTDEIFWDEYMRELYGVGSQVKITGEMWGNFILDEDLPKVRRIVNQARKTRKPYDFVFRIKNTRGKVRYLQTIGIIKRSEHGNQFEGINRDITNERKREIKLNRLNEQMSLVIDASKHGYWDMDISSKAVYCSEMYWKIHGLVPRQKSQPADFWKDFVHPEDLPKIEMALQNALTRNGRYEVESRRKHADGRWVWVHVRGIVTRNKKNDPVRLSGTIVDIDEKKQFLLRLSESEERLRFIAENTSDGIALIENGCITFSTPAFNCILGLSSEEVLKQDYDTIRESLHPADRDSISSLLNDAIANRVSSLSYQFRQRHSKGHYIWREDHVKFIYDHHGKIIKQVIVARDITKRKQGEIELAESKERYKLLVENSYEIIAKLDSNNNFLYVSPSVQEVLGYEPSQLIGRNLNELVHPEDNKKIKERRFRHCNGKYIWLLTSVKSLPGNSLIVHFRNVTQEVKARRALMLSEEMLSDIANSIPGLIMRYLIRTDGSDKVEYVSKGGEKLWELSIEEMQQDSSKIWSKIHPDDVDMVNTSISESQKTLTTWRCEYRAVMDDGRVKWINAVGLPKKLKDGSILWHSVALDSTIHKEAELENLKLVKELEQALNDKNNLFKELHHRIKNNLQLIN